MKPEDLKSRTKRYALDVIALYSSLRRETVAQVIGRQFLRSGTSVGANYREASRARSNAEFIAKIGDCLKELEETIYWLELLIDSSTMPTAKVEPLLRETDELTAIMTAVSKNAQKRA